MLSRVYIILSYNICRAVTFVVGIYNDFHDIIAFYAQIFHENVLL